MKGKKEIIEALNQLLTAELTAINQYYVHYKMCENWGYKRMAHHFRELSMGEMKDADEVIERILFLEGVPNMQRMNPVKVGETVAEQLQLARELESGQVKMLNDLVALARDAGDNGTRHLAEHGLLDEERHLDWAESQLGIIEDVGIKNYLAEMIAHE
ncbi:MAG: bacterioferritin [Planctomycetes bacterium]|nr:bacterioferritin [Planctomycetota bacterium]MCB9903178.1 bacterioferritin [Planctomycetota bacterium]